MAEITKELLLKINDLGAVSLAITVNFWLVTHFLKILDKLEQRAAKERKERDEMFFNNLNNHRKELLNVLQENTQAINNLKNYLEPKYSDPQKIKKLWR